jgi:hypothetical protein
MMIRNLYLSISTVFFNSTMPVYVSILAYIDSNSWNLDEFNVILKTESL